MVASWASSTGADTVTQPEPTKAKDKYCSVNPYGWRPEIMEFKKPEESPRFVGRLDSWKTYRNSPLAKKGVDNTWLSGGGNKASDVKGKGRVVGMMMWRWVWLGRGQCSAVGEGK
jgi:hypothetical protein